jgi:hypothetical protein
MSKSSGREPDGHRDRNGVLISPEQTAGPAVEAKPFEQKNFVGGERVHAPVPPRARAKPGSTGSPMNLRSLRKIQKI